MRQFALSGLIPSYEMSRGRADKVRYMTCMENSIYKTSRAVTNWLGFMCLLIVAMIVIGGATRLTNSGLSITEWKPITGALPPLSDAQWLSEFEKYKLIPEFEAEHPDMDLAGFKFIYFWEWAHRQLGRFIGLAYALPFFVFLAGRKLPKSRALLFWAVLFLIGMQGAIGWWMVHSGLQDGMVNVSQYRLATHLGMAFIILGVLFTLFLGARHGWPMRRIQPMKTGAALLLAGTFLQIVAGAFVAGTKAGYSYNSWPLMDGKFIPSGYFLTSPAWRNIFENIAAIQFNHRILAYILLAGCVWFWLRARKEAQAWTLNLSGWLLIAMIWQAVLGVWTLLMVAPLSLSLIHQASAIIVFLLAVALYKSTRIRAA